MTVEHLRVLVDFHAWQGASLLDAAARVPIDALMTTEVNNGSLFEALRHVVDVNFSWRCAAEGLPDPGLAWNVHPMEDLASLRAFWTAEDARLTVLVASWGPDDLERVVTPSWRTEPFKLWQVVLHIVTHQSDAVTEIGWALTRLGHSPGEIGFMPYVNTHRGASGL